MRKALKYFIFTIILSFSLCFNVNAECSYSERKDMLKAAKAIDIKMEIVEKENNKYEFKYYVTNLPENLFITYYNTNQGTENYISYKNLTDGIFSFVDDNYLLVYDYVFEITSLNPNCYGYELHKKKLKKPMYNIYSENINCSTEEFEKFKYCQKFFEEDYRLTEDEFYSSLISYNANLSPTGPVEEPEEQSFIQKYLVYIISIPTILAITIVTIVLIKKKKNEL